MPHLRIALALLFLTASAPSQAQQSFLSCLDQNQSWSAGFSAGAVQSVTYVISMQLQPAPPVYVRPLANSFGWLIATKRTGGINTTEMLVGVPQTVAAQYQHLTNAETQFANDSRRFHELLLIDGSACPLLIEDAAYSSTGAPFWTH